MVAAVTDDPLAAEIAAGWRAAAEDAAQILTILPPDHPGRSHHTGMVRRCLARAEELEALTPNQTGRKFNRQPLSSPTG